MYTDTHQMDSHILTDMFDILEQQFILIWQMFII